MEPRDGKVLETLFKNGPLSNQEIAAKLALSPSAVSSATSRLLKEGAVVSRDPGRFNRDVGPGERRKRTFQPNPEYGFAAVIEIDFDYLTVHLIQWDLECVHTKRVPVEGKDRDVILETIDQELQLLIGSIADRRFCGIGFSMPGQVDPVRNIAVHNTRIDKWDNVDFNRFNRYSRTIVTENVANAVALGEHLRGAAVEVDDFMLIRVGNGAGMGIIIGGNLHRGHNYAAGEAGHVIIDEGSQTTCACGNRGCLESFVSRRAVMRELTRLRDSEVPSRILADLESHHGDGIFRVLGKYYESGDKVAYLVMQELAHKLGLAAANFVQVLAPARIVVSGPITKLGEPFLSLLEQNLRRYQLPWLEPVPVVYGQDANLAAAQGTAMLVFRRSWDD